jgi:hypothetical protein
VIFKLPILGEKFIYMGLSLSEQEILKLDWNSQKWSRFWIFQLNEQQFKGTGETLEKFETMNSLIFHLSSNPFLFENFVRIFIISSSCHWEFFSSIFFFSWI